MTRPRIRLIWQPGSGRIVTCGRGDHYGWRLWLGIGPLTVLIGRTQETQT